MHLSNPNKIPKHVTHLFRLLVITLQRPHAVANDNNIVLVSQLSQDILHSAYVQLNEGL